MQTNEQKKKEALTRFALIMGLILVVLAIVGTTLAIFFHEIYKQSDINFGVIKLDGTNDYFGQKVLEKIIPGGKMVEEISFAKSADSAPLYVRVKLDFEIPSYEAIRLEEELAILNSSNFDGSIYSSNDVSYQWSDRQSDGYYYLLKKQTGVAKNLCELYVLDEVVYFSKGLMLPLEFEQETDENGNVLSYGAKIFVSLCVESIQAENVPEDTQTIANIAKYFEAKKLSFSFRYGLYEKREGLINYFGYNVGDLLPIIESQDRKKKLVWFEEETCMGDPLPSTTTIAENGVYYGAWFETVKAGDIEKSAASLVAYKGTSKNIIIPCNDLGITSVTSLATSTNKNTSVVRVIFEEGVIGISDGAFRNTPNLSTIILPEGLMEIGANLFDPENCDVTRITIPSSVSNVNQAAFNAPSISRVISSSVFTLNPSGHPYFDVVNGSSTYYDKIYFGGAYYIKDGTKAIPVEYNRILESFIIPTKVKLNGEDLKVDALTEKLCYGYSKVKEIIVSEGIKTVGVRTFASCANLIRIDLPTSLETIEESCFEGCVNMFKFTIPRNVITIKKNAFKNVNSNKNAYAVIAPGGTQAITTYRYTGTEYEASSIALPNTAVEIRGGIGATYTRVVEFLDNDVENYYYVKTADLVAKNIMIVIPYTVTHIGTTAFTGMYFNIVVFRGALPEIIDPVVNVKNYHLLFTVVDGVSDTLYVPTYHLGAYDLAFNNSGFDIHTGYPEE